MTASFGLLLSDIVGYSDLTLLVTHEVLLILLEQKLLIFLGLVALLHNGILLDVSNIKVKHCNALNPASLLPIADDASKEEAGDHDCVSILCSAVHDLKETPLDNPDLVLFVDGSASRDPGTDINNTSHISLFCTYCGDGWSYFCMSAGCK